MARIESDALIVEIETTAGSWRLIDKRSGAKWPSEGYARFGDAPNLGGDYSLGIANKEQSIRLENSAGGAVVFDLAHGGRQVELRYESIGDETLHILDDLLAMKDSDEGYVIVPCREGLLIPAQGQKTFEREFGASEYEGCHMNMLAFSKNGSGLLVTWDDAYTFPKVQRQPVEGDSESLELTTTFALQGSARSLRLAPTGPGDWNTLASAYRELSEEKGYALTLREKMARASQMENLLGAASVKMWHCLARMVNEDGAETVTVRYTFEECSQIAEHLKNDLGMMRCLFTIGGWINGGYDVRHPDILPANPECGGDEGLAGALRRIKELGFVSSLHDNYQDMYTDAPSYDPGLAQKKADGSIHLGQHWNGGVPALVCAPKQLDLAQRPGNLPAVRERFSPDLYFIDTTFAVGPQECSDPEHPLDRNTDIEWKLKLAEYARETFGLFGSECGREWAIPHSDVFEGVMSVYGNYFHGLDPADMDGAVIPFWEMVYHDCQICYGKYHCEPEWAAESIAQHVLCARPFFYHFGEVSPTHLYWEATEPDGSPSSPITDSNCVFARSDTGWAAGMHPLDVFIKNTHEVLGPLHTTTAFNRLTRFEFLCSDRSLRKAVYGEESGGTTVTVNFGSENATVTSKTYGTVVLPQWGFLVESPTFLAVHALRWNEQDHDDSALFTLRVESGDTLGEADRIRVFHAFGSPTLTWNSKEYSVTRDDIISVR